MNWITSSRITIVRLARSLQSRLREPATHYWRGTHCRRRYERTPVTVNSSLLRGLAAGFALAASLATGCSDHSGRRNVPMRESTDASRFSPPRGFDSTRAEGTVKCERLESTDVTLCGTVTTQVRLGAPGYGETPRRDRKGTIIVLHTELPLILCDDSTGDMGSGKFRNLRDVQLTGRVAGLQSRVPTTVVVRGTLLRAELPWHYTPVVLRVEELLNQPAIKRPTRTAAIRKVS